MSDEKYARSIALLCPTCGRDQFVFDDETSSNEHRIVTCNNCGKTMTQADLIEANHEQIDSEKEAMTSEVIADFKKSLSKSIGSNKHLRIKL